MKENESEKTEEKAANDKETTGTLSKVFSSEIFHILIAAIVGAGLALLGTFINDWRKEGQTRESLKKIISYDIINTTSKLDEFLKVTPRTEMIEKSYNPEWAPYITDYDTSVLDAYIHKISLLPEHSARRILLFYKNLRTANGAKYLIQNNGSNMPHKERQAWAGILYNAIDKAAIVGNEMITDDKKLNTTERCDSYYLKFDAASSSAY